MSEFIVPSSLLQVLFKEDGEIDSKHVSSALAKNWAQKGCSGARALKGQRAKRRLLHSWSCGKPAAWRRNHRPPWVL